MPPTSTYALTTPEKKILTKFALTSKQIVCPKCGVNGTIRKCGRAGKTNKLAFKCKCSRKVGAAHMEKILRTLITPPVKDALSQFFGPILSSPRTASQSSSIVPETPCPASRRPSVLLETSPVALSLPEPCPASPCQTSPPNAVSASLLQELISKVNHLEGVVSSQRTEINRLNAQQKLLKQQVAIAQKTFEDALVKTTNPYMNVSHLVPAESFSPDIPGESPSKVAPPASKVRNQPVPLPARPQPAQDSPRPSYAQVVAAQADTSAASLPEVVNPMAEIPDTYAGRTLSRFVNQSRKPVQDPAVPPPAHPQEGGSVAPRNKGKAPQRNYQPPSNPPPVATWTCLYFAQVPWTTLSSIRKTFRALNFDMNKIVNLAWRRGKILEIILDRSLATAFTSYVQDHLNWKATHFTIVPEETSLLDPQLFSKPPAHLAIMAFFAAIKRQAPNQDIAYFLKEHAISMLSDFSDAPFNQLWDAAGPLDRVAAQPSGTSA